ncbi:MAG: hypothetical protein R2731_09225 [Nocardioides sp.]
MADDSTGTSGEAGRRGRTARRVAALAPLLPLTAAWTLLLSDPAATPGAGIALVPLAVSYAEPAAAYPEVTTISAPETAGGSTALTSTAVDRERTVVDDIPDVALAAYQRAATVANAADAGCHVPWELIAAVGRVESNHGRFGGSRLDADGVAMPPILGVRLDGRHGTSTIADTDAGELDGDRRFDRAVGPMQFIPATWAYVGVDADGDGVRNPQDIDVAALSAAVYLCAGGDDLATDAGQRHAVHRYNHSASYVETVLAIMRSYQRGDLWTVPGVAPGGPVVVGQEPPAPLPPAPDPQLEADVREPMSVHEDTPSAEPTPAEPIEPEPGVDPGEPPAPEPSTDPSDSPSDPSDSPSDDPSETPQPDDESSASPGADGDPALAPGTPEEQAAALCALVGRPEDLTCLEVALTDSDSPTWVLPTAEDLLTRLDELGA